MIYGTVIILHLFLTCSKNFGLASPATNPPTLSTDEKKNVPGIRPVAIITGGTRGIGSGIASALCDAGYDLLLTYNSNHKVAEQFVSTLIDGQDNDTTTTSNDNNIKVECVSGDISLVKTRDEIFKCLDERFHGQPLKAMIHNAGQYVGITSDNSDGISSEGSQLMFGDGSLLDSDTGRTNFDTMHYYQRMYGEAFIDLCERSLCRMKKANKEGGGGGGDGGGGSIIGVTSPGVNAALYGQDRTYSMAGSGKCIMEYSMRIYARQAGENNVNVNVIVPGFTKTDAWDKLAKNVMGLENSKELIDDLVERRCPMRRYMEPNDIGNIVKFLCSDAGRYITGVVLPIDGGCHLMMQ